MQAKWRFVLTAVAMVTAGGGLALAAAANGAGNPRVRFLRAPRGGIQPHAILGSDGVLHMIYFKGDPAAGDIEYVTRAPGAKEFSEPVRVNSQPGSAVAVGTVRGPQMAVGRDGSVDVVWFGSQKAKPRGQDGSTPVLYSRSNKERTAFEPQRALSKHSKEVDGGLSVAADRSGDVYVVWHAAGDKPGEAHRRVYLARSEDDGQTFAREVPVSPASLGACGCCGMRAFVGSGGSLYILYRAAAENVHRDMTLLVSADRGRTYQVRQVSSWLLKACPMSSDDLSEGGGRVLAAWERAGEVYFDEIIPGSARLSPAHAAPGAADDRKHPSVAANSSGQILLAWTEGTAWERGGSLAWQIFDASGRPAGPVGRAPDVPVWDAPNAFANPDGSFTIAY